MCVSGDSFQMQLLPLLWFGLIFTARQIACTWPPATLSMFILEACQGQARGGRDFYMKRQLCKQTERERSPRMMMREAALPRSPAAWSLGD